MTFISINVFHVIRRSAIIIGLTTFVSVRPCGLVIVILSTSLPTWCVVLARRKISLFNIEPRMEVPSAERLASDIGFHGGSQFVPIGKIPTRRTGSRSRASRRIPLFLSSLYAIAGVTTIDFVMQAFLHLIDYLSSSISRRDYAKLRAGPPRLCLALRDIAM